MLRREDVSAELRPDARTEELLLWTGVDLCGCDAFMHVARVPHRRKAKRAGRSCRRMGTPGVWFLGVPGTRSSTCPAATQSRVIHAPPPADG